MVFMSEKIPEHKLNVTKTVGQFIESMGNDRFFNIKRNNNQTAKSIDSDEEK